MNSNTRELWHTYCKESQTSSEINKLWRTFQSFFDTLCSSQFLFIVENLWSPQRHSI